MRFITKVHSFHDIFCRYINFLASVLATDKPQHDRARDANRKVIVHSTKGKINHKTASSIVLLKHSYSGPHTVSHSLSWSNSRSEIRNGVAYTKLWTPDDPRTAKANGYYPSET